MIFLHFQTKNPLHEWGWHSQIVPNVGDKVYLPYAKPDCDDDKEATYGTVVCRELMPPWGKDEDILDTIELVVELEGKIPAGMVAHSQEWPSESYTERKHA